MADNDYPFTEDEILQSLSVAAALTAEEPTVEQDAIRTLVEGYEDLRQQLTEAQAAIRWLTVPSTRTDDHFFTPSTQASIHHKAVKAAYDAAGE